MEQRLLSHNHLATKGWTIKFRPWDLIYTEKYEDKRTALIREKYLKSGGGREFIWGLVQTHLNSKM